MDGETPDRGEPVGDPGQGGAVGAGIRAPGDGVERPADPKPEQGLAKPRRPYARNRVALVHQARVLFEAGKDPREVARETGLRIEKVRQLALEQKWNSEEKYAKVISALNDNREDLKRRLLMKIIAGETPEIAARSVGLTKKELDIYVADDPDFEKHVVACRSAFLGDQEAKIASAPDWRAALEVLKRAKETRETWSAPENQRATIHIELNVPRDVD